MNTNSGKEQIGITQKQQISFKEDFICGSISGVANCLSGYIFDTLKVKVQMDPSRSMFDYIKLMYRQNRLINLFDGMHYPLITVPLVNSVVFGSYEFYKKITGKTQLSFLDGIQNGAFAGLVNTVVVTPVQLIKCRMQLENSLFKTSQQCFKSIWKNEGIRGFYHGNIACIARQIPAYAAQFSTYEFLKQLLTNEQKPSMSFLESMVVGALAGINCWLFSYPQDIIKTKIQVEREKYQIKRYYIVSDGMIIDCGKKIYGNNWRNLFTGLSPCLVRAVVANAFGIATYEKAQMLFKKYNRHF